MKKIISGITAASIILSGMAPLTFAQTSTSTSTTTAELIVQLEAQIKVLKAKLEELIRARSAVQQAALDVAETRALILVRHLSEGLSGEDIKTLQAILAADADIYPEGLITGYYGKLTAKAVKRFQKKHGIEQLGIVGPKTLKKLNELLKKNQLAIESGVVVTANGATTTAPVICAIVPPGHLIAPGWLRKQGGVRPIVPACQVLPPGIAKQLGTATSTTSTPDTTAPTISSIAVTGLMHNAAHVTWTTNEAATSKVWYSTSSPVVATSSTPMVSSGALVVNHDLALTGLTASTAYYFTVVSADAAGNTATSSQASFTTSAAPDTTAPIISNVSATSTTASSTKIIWTTDEAATSKVWYSTSSPVVASSPTPMVSDGALVTSHELMLASLTASTTYYYLATSADAAGNTATSSQASVTTQ